jgi:hypothetical protein
MSARRFLALASLFLAFTALVVAQTGTCRLQGTVQDQTGAVVPNAKVSATNVKTQVTVDVTTGPEGIYVLAALPPGTYNLVIDSAGFRKSAISNIELTTGDTVTQNVKLEIGQNVEVVQVEANTVTVQTAESSIARAVTTRDISTLPTVGRAPIALSYYQPGVSFDPGDSTFSRINGARQGSNNSSLDGIDVNDAVVPRLGLAMTATNVDSVEEVRLITEGGKAEYGRNAGGQVEMITRSGSNTYHGNLYEYLRNTAVNANDFFSNAAQPYVSRPMFIQNMFGGSLGGRIIRDKLFVFGNFQGRRTHQQVSRVRTVPTAMIKQGIFQWVQPGTSAVQSYNIVANDPLHIGIDPAVKKLLDMYPDPNDTSVGDGLNTTGFRFNQPANSLEDQFTIKGDYYLNPVNHFFYRHSWQRNSSIDTLNNADAPFPGGVQGTQGGHRWGLAAGWTWTARNDLINEFRYGHQSATAAFNRPQRQPNMMFGFNSFTDPLLRNYAQGRVSPVDEYTDNLTWIRGAHTVKGGTNIRYTLQHGYNDAGLWPNALFSTAYALVPAGVGPASGTIASADLQRFQGLYNDLLGRVGQVTQTFYTNLKQYQPANQSSIRNYNFHDYGFFLQDDWKARPNLTFNIGLRWEIFATPKEANGLQGTVSNIDTFSPFVPQNNLSVQPAEKWYSTDMNNLAPRFGFSWDPSNTGRWAIRGNYGIFYDRIIGATTSLVDSNSPGFTDARTAFWSSTQANDNRATAGPTLPTHGDTPLTTPAVTRQTSIVLFNPNLATGYVHQYSLNVQREISRNNLLEIGYVGTRGVKLFMDRDINQPQVYRDFLGAVQELQRFRANSANVPSANNTLVKIFGTPAAAVTALSGTTIDQGQLGTLANTLDRTNYSKYANAGVSDFYLRPFPQFNQVIWGANDGRSYYDSLQVSFRRNTGALKYTFNYTFSKLIDNGSVDGNGFTNVPDNNNLKLNRARGDYDRPHSLNYQVMYTFPIGKGKHFGSSMPRWADSLIGGWDIGALGVWQSGGVFSVTSGRATGPGTFTTYADYSGSRTVGSVDRRGNGVFFLDPASISQYTFPVAGAIGTSGRNSFRGPRYFNIDLSLVKRFKITENHSVLLRAEAYNLLNNVNFANPAASIATPTSFGKISTARTARIMQLALRYEF